MGGEKMDLKDVYSRSYSFLLDESAPYNISKNMIDAFISNSDAPECEDIESAYRLLLVIMQDFQMYPNVIQFKQRESCIIETLHNCDLKYISSLTPEQLLSDFKNKFGFEKDCIWHKYCKSIISGALFMLNFKDDAEYKSTFDSFNKNDMTREAFALFLSRKIFNMGFAIACNWLKELGYYKYAKPDTHTKDVCRSLGLLTDDDDINCFEAMIKTANEAGVEAYKVDKVWWLICSGNYYRYNIILPNPRQRKERFLNMLKDLQY